MTDVEILSLESAKSPTQIQEILKNKNFSSSFWGEKLVGFETLWSNLRSSSTSVKELEAYLKDMVQIYDSYAKQSTKLSSQIRRYSSDSSISYLWRNMVAVLCESYAWQHIHFVNRLQELIREVQAYNSELRNKKKRLKDLEMKTSMIIEQFKATKVQLFRTRDNYLTLAGEIDKQKRNLAENANSSQEKQLQMIQNQHQPLQQSNSASSVSSFQLGMTNSIQKIDKKHQQAIDEYKLAIERYNAARDFYIRQFGDSCQAFQTYEEAHINQMKKFLQTFDQSLETHNQALQKSQAEFRFKLNNVFTTELLIGQYVVMKGTGTEMPEVAEFVEYVPGSVFKQFNETMPALPTHFTAVDQEVASSYFTPNKKRSSPVRKQPSRQVTSPSMPIQPPNSLFLDPFELSPPAQNPSPILTNSTQPLSPTTTIPQLPTPTSETPTNRKRSMVVNLSNVFNWDSIFTKFIRDNNKLRESSQRAVTPSTTVAEPIPVVEPQLIDIESSDQPATMLSPQQTESTTNNDQVAVRSNRELFQRAKQMRMLTRVGLNKKKRQNSLPSEVDKNDDGEKEKRGKSKDAEVKLGSSYITPKSIIPNDQSDQVDEEFDYTAFDELRNTANKRVSTALDDEDEFFRAFEELKLKKTLRKNSADMNNFYESSLGSSDSRKENKQNTPNFDINNNDLFHHLNMTDSQSQTSTEDHNHQPNDCDDDSFSDDSDDSDAPKKILVKIKTVAEVDLDKTRVQTSDIMLSQIGKNLKLQTATKHLPESSLKMARSRPLSPEPPVSITLPFNNNFSQTNLAKPSKDQIANSINNQTAPPLPPLPFHLQNKIVPPRPKQIPVPLPIPTPVATIVSENKVNSGSDNISSSSSSGRNSSLAEYKITDGVIKF